MRLVRRSGWRLCQQQEPPTPEPKEETKKENASKDTNVIFVGSKPIMNYVTGIMMQFNTKKAPEVIIKARGKFISKAVDVAEVARKRFLEEQNISAKNIIIGTEDYDKEGKTISVSTIDIKLSR